MSNNDPTEELLEDKAKTTQPMIADVFRLVEQMNQNMEARFQAIEKRLDGIDARLDELSDEMKSGFMKLEDKIDRSTLHAEADYHDLLKRIRQLESKAS